MKQQQHQCAEKRRLSTFFVLIGYCFSPFAPLLLVALLVLTTILEPVGSFTVSLSSSWHHRHAPPPPLQQQQQQRLHHDVYYQQKTTLREQEAAAQGEVSLIQNDHDDDNDDVSSLRSITFHNLPKNIIMMDIIDNNNADNAEEEEEEAGPDLLADFLMEIGACSVTLTDSDANTERESPLFHEPLPLSGGNDNDSSIAWHDSLHWAAPIWNKCNLTAHFAASVDIDNVLQLVQATFPQYQLFSSSLGGEGGGTTTTSLQQQQMFSIETVPNRDWVVHVQSSWKPIVVPGGGFSSNFNNQDKQHILDERIRLQPSSRSNTLFVLQFPWHSNEDVKRAILLQEQQQQQQQTALLTYQPSQVGQEEEKEKKKNIVTIQLQGGIAFGTGEHATTQLCLQWLDRVIPRVLVEQCSSSSSKIDNDSTSSEEQQHKTKNNDILRILDYGAGSGILGIAALKLAAAAAAAAASQQSTTTTTATTAHAVGIDIDVDACRIANANAIINNVSQFKTYLPPLAKTMDDESKSLLLKARAHAARQQHQQQQQGHNDDADNNNNDHCLTITLPRREQEQLYDVCVANILAAPLIALAPEIVAMLKPGTDGWLGMSGILPHQGQAVVQAYTAAGLEHVCVEQEMGGWNLVTGRRRKE